MEPDPMWETRKFYPHTPAKGTGAHTPTPPPNMHTHPHMHTHPPRTQARLPSIRITES